MPEQSGAFEGSFLGQVQPERYSQGTTSGGPLREDRKILVGSSRSRALRIAFQGFRPSRGELGNGIPKDARRTGGSSRPGQVELSGEIILNNNLP